MGGGGHAPQQRSAPPQRQAPVANKAPAKSNTGFDDMDDDIPF
jgi:single-strand DNA-binding protein